MTIDTKTLISISEANQNFSKVARLVDECGSAVILKNNVPRYLVIDFSKAEQETTASDDDVLSIDSCQNGTARGKPSNWMLFVYRSNRCW